MSRNWFNSPPDNAIRGLDIVRVAIAAIISVHGFHALLDPPKTAGFGEYLGSLGFPFGVALAWFIVFLQITCCIALVFRRLIVPACIGNIIILGFGIVLIHAPRRMVCGWSRKKRGRI
jgi:putative oxidoreductase